MGERSQKEVESLIESNATVFDSKEMLAVHPRPRYVNGKADWSRCHIEVVARRPPELHLPESIESVPIVKVAATLEEQAVRALAIRGKPVSDAELTSDWRTGLLTALIEKPRDYSTLTYKPFAPSKLVEVNEDCELILHVSPDAAWPVLEDFLGEADRHVVAMYDFTAPHIIERFTSAGQSADHIALCLGPNEALNSNTKANDWHEEDVFEHLRNKLKSKFKFSWASTGLDRR
jgi:hypothetical protein